MTASRGFRRSDLNRLRTKLGPSKLPSKAAGYLTSVHALCDSYGLPRPIAEYTFHPLRRWRADFYWPEFRVAMEIDGGIWVQGRHTRGSGFVKDLEKRRGYAACGILVVPCTPKELYAGIWVEAVREAMRWAE